MKKGKTKNMANAQKKNDTVSEPKDLLASSPMQLAEQETNAALLAEFGPSPLQAKDLVIPYILLLNPTSKKVTNGEGAFGDFMNSLTNEKVGDLRTSFQFVPFWMRQTWVEYDVTDPKKKKFLRVVEMTPANNKLPYEFSEKDKDGKTIPCGRDDVMNFYGFLKKDLVKGGAIPLILSFRRSSYKEGKNLANKMFVHNVNQGLPWCAYTVTITAEKRSNEASTWAIPTAGISAELTEKTSKEHMLECLKWYKQIQTGAVKEDEDQIVGETEVVSETVASGGPKEF